jgi:hypothetical protein
LPLQNLSSNKVSRENFKTNREVYEVYSPNKRVGAAADGGDHSGMENIYNVYTVCHYGKYLVIIIHRVE